jgi:hypothetical protein
VVLQVTNHQAHHHHQAVVQLLIHRAGPHHHHHHIIKYSTFNGSFTTNVQLDKKVCIILLLTVVITHQEGGKTIASQIFQFQT